MSLWHESDGLGEKEFSFSYSERRAHEAQREKPCKGVPVCLRKKREEKKLARLLVPFQPLFLFCIAPSENMAGAA